MNLDLSLNKIWLVFFEWFSRSWITPTPSKKQIMMSGNYDHLLREVDTSNKYDKYFNKSSCQSSPQGYGTTDKTLKVLKKLTYQYKEDTKKITKKFFKTNDLQQLVATINNWLFYTFQYKVGGQKQNIASPNCAYSTRLEGIDCKTYALIAGTILLNRGVSFNFRKSKSENSNKWTHVYVVIPVDQQTYNLNNGYYLIDGTVQFPNEVNIKQTKDIFMAEKYEHYGLRGSESTNVFDQMLDGLSDYGLTDDTLLTIKDVFNSYTKQGFNPKFSLARKNNGVYVGDIFIPFEFKATGLNGEPFDFDIDSDVANSTGGGADGEGLDLLGLLGSLDIGNIVSGIMDGTIFCGSSAWKQEEFDRYSAGLQRYVTPILNNLSTNLTAAQVGSEINKLIRAGAMFEDHFQAKIDSGYNSCSTKVLKALRDLGRELINQTEITVNSFSNVNTTTQTQTASVDFQSIGMNEDNDGHQFTYTIYTITSQTANNGIIINNGTATNTNTDTLPKDKEKTNYTPILIGAVGLAKLAGLF